MFQSYHLYVTSMSAISDILVFQCMVNIYTHAQVSLLSSGLFPPSRSNTAYKETKLSCHTPDKTASKLYTIEQKQLYPHVENFV